MDGKDDYEKHFSFGAAYIRDLTLILTWPCFLSCYFDVCDGIFLNYTWKDEGLARSAELARSKGRLHDVCVGVDVFGRNCRGGGGFNTIEVTIQEENIFIISVYWLYQFPEFSRFTKHCTVYAVP